MHLLRFTLVFSPSSISSISQAANVALDVALRTEVVLLAGTDMKTAV